MVEEEKRRDGQTRNGFPLVRCKKRLKPFFVATFFAVRIELRMQPNQHPLDETNREVCFIVFTIYSIFINGKCLSIFPFELY